MTRGRKPFSASIADNWEKAFFNSIGHYITLINKGLSSSFKSEPLSNHIKIVGGFAFKNSEYKSSGIPIIRISDFNNERIVLDNVVYYDESLFLEKYELKESDIIIALTGGTIGKLGIVQAGLGKLYLNQRVGKFDILNPNEFEKEYIYWIARGVESIVKNLAWGAAIPNVSPKQIEDLNFPIPSKDIQKDIIRFLNDLKNGRVYGEIYFDEQIENEIKDIQEKQVKTREVQDELSRQLTLLENLNQAILQEAVQGKLVTQDPKDEPADQLLQRIKEELSSVREEYLPNGDCRWVKPKIKNFPPIKSEEIPFEIPKSWVWCRLGEICSKITDGTHHSPSNFEIGAYKYVTAKNIKDSGIDLSNITYVSEEVHREIYSRCNPTFGDILYIKDGATTGVVTINELEEEFSLLSSVALLKLPDLLYNKYVLNVMRSSFFYTATRREMYGVAITRVTLQKINNLIIPLPPLAEQKRIVAEIERQMAKTKELKEHIVNNQKATEQLLKALLHDAFEFQDARRNSAKA